MGCCIFSLSKKKIQPTDQKKVQLDQTFQCLEENFQKTDQSEQQQNIRQNYNNLSKIRQSHLYQKKVADFGQSTGVVSMDGQTQSKIFRKNKRKTQPPRYQQNINKMMEQAAKAHELQLFSQQKHIYEAGLKQVQTLTNHFDKDSLAELKAYIYSSLANAAISQNNQSQADNYFFQALQSYKNTVQMTFQERITLLNNYSLFKRSCGKLEQAKEHLKNAIDLMAKYYIINDERKYFALINMACLMYQSGCSKEGGNIIQSVIKQCKNKQVKQIAQTNQLLYQN